MNSLKQYSNFILEEQAHEILSYFLGSNYNDVPSFNYPKLVNEKAGFALIDSTDLIKDVFQKMKDWYNTNISKINIEQLLELGFFKHNSFKTNGLLIYTIIDEQDNSVVIEISTKRVDIYPYLVVNQYDWVYMENNETRLSINNIHDIETLKTGILDIEKFFKNN